MPDPNFLLLYVDNPPSSAAFYADLLGKQPLESSPTFAMFELSSGLMLGLWSRATVQPVATSTSASSELAIAVAGPEAVDAAHADWSRRGLKIAQVPTDMDFGRTFVALDPDGHRVRVFAASAS
jgi:predicted enzyme related to lactoylglutathione lyase